MEGDDLEIDVKRKIGEERWMRWCIYMI